jgi:hypothetical protein
MKDNLIEFDNAHYDAFANDWLKLIAYVEEAECDAIKCTEAMRLALRLNTMRLQKVDL